MSEEPRIGVYLCWCGSNIAKMVDIETLSEELASYPNVALAKHYKYMCSDPGQELLVKDIKENDLNRVVVAACSPRMHEVTFRKALENAGLNPYLFEMANIREQCAWVHEDKAVATEKAKALVIAAIERVRFHVPLDKQEVNINAATLVIGGGVAGMSAALDIADAGKQVYLVEQSDSLGGNVVNLDLTFPYMESGVDLLSPKIHRVENHDQIEVMKEATVSDVSGYVGNFNAKVSSSNGGGDKEVEVGNIVVATGLQSFDPSKVEEYHYGTFPNVVSSVDFEKMARAGKIATKDGREPKSVVIINCVGSRNKKTHEYCSRTCCLSALKYANQVKSALPNTHVYMAYTDMRVFGKGCEEFYERTCENDIRFMMFDKEEIPRVKKAGSGDDYEMLVELNEQLGGGMIEVPADLVILSVGMEARKDADHMAHIVGSCVDRTGFLLEKHPKLDPVATTTDGIFIAGCCQGPKDIPDSIAQGSAAAVRVLASISQGKVEVEAITSHVNEDVCAGCQTCIQVCPYTAISFNEERNVSVVNEVLCKGCGTCTSACPSAAITSKHFTKQQIMSQIEGMLASLRTAD